MLLSRIQKDLYDFIDNEDPEDLASLLNFWYDANSEALSAALTSQSGLNFIVDAKSIQSFENLSKKLFLLADTLILRSVDPASEDDIEKMMLVPTSGYQPGYLEEVIDELNKLRPSPMTLRMPAGFWSSTTKTLSTGLQAAYALQIMSRTSKELVCWISGKGRPYLETGRVVYAPFIPPREMEMEFLKNGLDLSAYFSSSPLFHQEHQWMSEKGMQTLFSLQFPFLDGLDIDLINEVKVDYRDEFENFSRSLVESIDAVKSSIGTDEFAKEVKYIQQNKIDAGINDVQKTFKKIESINSLRRSGMTIGLLGLSTAAYLGAPSVAIATGIAASGVKMIMDKIAHLKESNQLKEMDSYFLWKISRQ